MLNNCYHHNFLSPSLEVWVLLGKITTQESKPVNPQSLSPFLSLPLSLQPPLSWYHIKPDVKMCPNLRKVLDEDVLPFII